MADLEKTVAIIFSGDDQLSRTVRDINRSFGDFGDIAQTAAAPLATIAEGVLAADAAFATLAIGGMALAIREAGNFGDAFNEIATLIDAPRENLNQFRGDILDYATDSTAAIADINAAVYTAISAGTDYADALGVLSTAERLSVAGKADLEATTRLLASTLNAYGEGVDEATRYSDVFFQTVRDGQTTLPELAEGLSQVTGLAANAGVPIETLMASIAALTATGAPTSQAITQIRAAIQAIIDPSSQASEAAAALGIQFNAAALESMGLEGVLRQVYDATGGNIEQMSQLFGRVEGLNAALVLGADSSGIFANALLDMQNASGATEEAFRKMADNIALVNQTLANNVRAVLIGLGDELLGGYVDVARGIQDVLQSIGTGIDAGVFDPLFQAFDDFAGQLSDFLTQVADALPDALEQLNFNSFLDALDALGDAIGALFDGADLTNAEDLADVLQEIIDTGEALIRVTTGMALAFQPYFEALRQSVQEVNSWDAATQESFGKVLLAAEGVVKAGTGIGLAMAAIAESGFEIQNVFNAVFGSIQAVWNTLQVAFDTVASVIVNSIIDILDALEPITRFPGFSGLNESLRETRQELGYLSEGIRQHSFQQMEEAIDGASRAMRGFTGETEGAVEQATDLAQEIDEIPEEKAIAVEFSDAIAQEDIREIQQALDEMEEDPVFLEILPFEPPDDTALKQAMAALEAREITIDATVEADTDAAERKLKAIEEYSDIVQEKMKWEAEIEITQAQEATKRIEAAFESVNVSIQSTGETLTGLFSAFSEVEGFSQRWLLEDAIRQEMELRQQAFQLQSRLVNSTIELNKQKAQRLESGDALITISGEGMSPALEMVLWEIVERIQMRVIETGSEALIDLASFTGL